MPREKKTSESFSGNAVDMAILRHQAEKSSRYLSELIREAIHEWIVKHVGEGR